MPVTPGFKGAKEIPRLTRQKYPYLVKQLKDFRDGTRTNDDGVMGAAVKDLTDAQIEAIAQYISRAFQTRVSSLSILNLLRAGM
jgi:cytochrome c553